MHCYFITLLYECIIALSCYCALYIAYGMLYVVYCARLHVAFVCIVLFIQYYVNKLRMCVVCNAYRVIMNCVIHCALCSVYNCCCILYFYFVSCYIACCTTCYISLHLAWCIVKYCLLQHVYCIRLSVLYCIFLFCNISIVQ